ncbi:hypothetical protein CN918_26415 [Priestia megaterium]|nr:hypothetical protein CN918_26415 [Priestia megaterium]
MMTLKDLLPKRKKTERVTVLHEHDGLYMRFLVEFNRLPFKKRRFEVELVKDEQHITVRYFHGPDDNPDYPPLQRFLARMQDHIKKHPELRLRAVTGALKTFIEAVEEERENTSVDMHDMTSFFIGLLLAVSCIFHVLNAFHITLMGFQIMGILLFVGLLFMAASVWFEERNDIHNSTFWTFFFVSILFVVALTIALTAGLFLALCVSWILPWWASIGGFLAVLFGYHWIVKAVRKVGDINRKYSSGA